MNLFFRRLINEGQNHRNVFLPLSTCLRIYPDTYLGLNRKLSTTTILNIKEIRATENGNVTLVEGVTLDSPRKDFLIPADVPWHNTCTDCPICRLNLPVRIKHTDVLILSQFVRSDGCLLPARITGLCKKQQRTITYLVAMAHKAGLMPNLGPAHSKKDPKKRFQWKKYNKYYDENVIEEQFFTRKTNRAQ